MVPVTIKIIPKTGIPQEPGRNSPGTRNFLQESTT
jgi:hypothetical protein